MTGSIARAEISAKKDIIISLAQRIWENPEVAYLEKNACHWTAEFLKAEGFTTEIGYAGLPTAIKATWGEGKPVIGFLGEYDALSGLSQKVSTIKEQVAEGAPGQGCGHNLIGAACVAAVLGAKREMQEKGLKGTLVFYGCPAEEELTGKVFMARNGAFKELDIAFAYHPGSAYMYSMGRFTALNSAKFHFKGKTAHAGGDPQNGRSALDAAELMNVGANFLREHVTDDVRIHYAFTDVHSAPNVVPDKATVWYYIRALDRETVVDTYDRLIKVAKGAALMTETEVEIEFLGGCYNTQQNKTLLNLIRDTAIELGPIAWTDEEHAFAQKLDEQGTAKQGLAGNLPQHYYLDFNPAAEINNIDVYGSTDVGDVQHIVPGVFFMIPSASIKAGNHTWQVTACSGHSIGMKGMLSSGEIMAVAAIKAIESPAIIEAAQGEFAKAMEDRPYICPIDESVSVPYSN